MQANLRGRVTCSSAHTEMNLLRSRTRATAQKIWLCGVVLPISEPSTCTGLTPYLITCVEGPCGGSILDGSSDNGATLVSPWYFNNLGVLARQWQRFGEGRKRE